MPILPTVHLALRVPLIGVELLPQRPHPIHLRVVHPERRVAGRREHVAARIAADREVAAAVRADLDAGKAAFG